GVRMDAPGAEWRATLSDLTVQNAAIRKLNHTGRLEAVGEHASGIAHDLNNLLYSIAGHIEIALHSLAEGDAAYRSLAQVRNVLGRCAAATEQLATFSRAEGAQPAIVNINDAIVEMKGVLRSLLGDAIELEIDAAATEPSVHMDGGHVEQILLSAV